jgi:hypothetical protein
LQLALNLKASEAEKITPAMLAIGGFTTVKTVINRPNIPEFTRCYGHTSVRLEDLSFATRIFIVFLFVFSNFAVAVAVKSRQKQKITLQTLYMLRWLYFTFLDISPLQDTSLIALIIQLYLSAQYTTTRIDKSHP